MKFLLDTCTFLWILLSDPLIKPSLKHKIFGEDNEMYLSVVSVWEICIKQMTGRFNLPADAGIYIPQQRKKHQILSLDLDEQSICHLSKLPSIHKDPFDRILICQAMEHGMTIVTPDQNIRNYPIKTLWED